MNELDYYDYELPKELIAQQPLEDRNSARMMVVDRKTQQISHLHVGDFPGLLSPLDTIVLNNTKVVPARLIGRRSQTGGHWEGLFLEILPQTGGQTARWHIMGSTRGKLLEGESVVLNTPDGTDNIEIQFVEKQADGTWIVEPRSSSSYLDILEAVGRVPIPPYIRDGKMEESDKDNYQTVFASIPGAVAAPTAGLHFSAEMLQTIQKTGAEIEYVTLHVGIGTFKPISVEKLSEHKMHHEFACIDAQTVEKIQSRRAAGGRTIAIGTTSVRTLESAAGSGILRPYADQTNLFIKPPYSFKATDAILTNFHLPKSTLLVMIRTFGGDELIKEAYQQAIEAKYRFYSYGDCMVII